MTDPGLQGMDDEGRDLRAALGGLLTDEPTAPWSVQDDVRRGEALRHRRRTRTLGTVGIAAALVLVAGLVGPLRPGAVVVPSAAPAVEGVPQVWLDRITPALQDQALLAVDWDASTVSGSVASGFEADLTTVPVERHSVGDPQYVLADRTATARLVLTWYPGASSPGPALQKCPVSDCPDQGPTGEVGGSIDQAATAGPGSTYPEGTQITDRVYPSGLLELVAYPAVPLDGSAPVARSPLQGQRATWFLDAVGDPSTAGRDGTGLDKAAVSALLNQLGWDVIGVTDVRTEPDPTVTKWSVMRTGDGAVAALTVRTWETGGGATPKGSVVAACSRDRSCETVASAIVDCTGSPCWSTTSSTVTAGDDVTPTGTRVLLAYDDVAGKAVEVVATPTDCGPTCDPATGTPPAFLADDQLQQVLSLVQSQVLAATPTPQPSPPATVTGLLESYGFAIQATTPLGQSDPQMTRYDVDVDQSADQPSIAGLTVSVWPGVRLTGDELPRLSFLRRCTDATCGPVTTIPAVCADGTPCDIRTAAATEKNGYFVGGARLYLQQTPDGVREIAVGHARCDTCQRQSIATKPFLTEEQSLAVLSAVDVAPQGGPTGGPAAACTSDDVKLIPEIDPIPTPAGLTVLRIRVIPRNPEVACVLRGAPTVEPRGSGGVLGYDVVTASSSGDVALDDSREAQFQVNFTICAPVGGDLSTLRVTMPGGGDPLDVSVSMFVGVASCAVGATASTNLGVSVFQEADARECTSNDVTMVAAKDTAGGQTGERSVRIEVSPSSSDVRCTLTQQPDVALLDARGAALSFQQSSGGFQGVDSERISTVLLRSGVVGYVVLSKLRCDTGGTAVDSLRLALADGDPVPVALPNGIGGLERCDGGGDAPGNTVWISQWGQT